jgi:uncharacterized protein YcfJ
MKRSYPAYFAVVILIVAVMSCAAPQDRYNTQRGAAIGAGVGAVAGQAIGRNTEATLLGAGIGTLLGAILGNAADQSHQAAREAAMTNKRVVYYDDKGGALEAIPGPVDQHTKCRKVTKRIWENGQLMTEKTEEVCEGEKSSRDY